MYNMSGPSGLRKDTGTGNEKRQKAGSHAWMGCVPHVLHACSVLAEFLRVRMAGADPFVAAFYDGGLLLCDRRREYRGEAQALGGVCRAPGEGADAPVLPVCPAVHGYRGSRLCLQGAVHLGTAGPDGAELGAADRSADHAPAVYHMGSLVRAGLSERDHRVPADALAGGAHRHRADGGRADRRVPGRGEHPRRAGPGAEGRLLPDSWCSGSRP